MEDMRQRIKSMELISSGETQQLLEQWEEWLLLYEDYSGKSAKLEACMAGAKPETKVQLIRNGYFSVDPKDSTEEHLVLNRIVGLKSSYKPGV